MAVLSFKVQADYEKVVRLREEIAKLENQLKSFGRNTPLNEIKAVENKLADAKRQFTSLATEAAESGARVNAATSSMAKNIAGLFSVKMAADFTMQVAAVRGEFQKLEMSFETMLQNKEKADALMAQMVKAAATTPFGLQEVAGGAKQLLAYGVASEKVNDTLIRLGDIAAGLKIPLGDLVYLYGTTMAQGRMFTMDLRQFQGRGIPMTEELAKVMGVAKNEVAGLVTAGKVGFKEMEAAIQSMTSSGGKFSGLMEKQSKTISGQMSNLEDSIEQMFNEIGKSAEGAISGAISVAADLVENYKEVGEAIAKIAVVFGTYKAALATMSALNTVAIKTERDMLLQLLAVETQQNAVENAGVATTGRVVAANEAEIATLRQQLAAKMQSLQTTLLTARAEEATARTKVERLRIEVGLSKMKTTQLKEELALAVASGNTEAIAVARTNLATAAKERNNASHALGLATRELEIAATNAETAASAVNTLQTNIETAAIDNQTRATLLLTAAKQKLAAFGKGIGKVLGNPYVLAAAAVAALTASIIGIVDTLNVEDEAHKNVTDAIKKHNEALAEYKSKGEELIGVINDEARTNMEKARAISELRALYPSLFKDMSDAEILAMKQVDANKKLAEETERLREEELKLSLQRKRDALSAQEGTRTVVGANGATYEVSNGDSVQARRLREEIRLLEKELADFEELKKRAEFNALPKEAKIVSLKEQIASLEEENKQLDEQIQEIAAKKWTIEDLGNLNFDWGADSSTEEIIARMEANREKAAALLKEVEKLEKVEDTSGETDKQKQARYNRKKALDKAKDDMIKTERDLQNKVTESKIKAMDDGLAKELAQLKHNFDKQEQAYENEQKDLLKKMQENEKQQWLAADPDRKEFNFVPTINKNSPEYQKLVAQYKTMGEEAVKAYNKAVEDAQEKWTFANRQQVIDSMSEGDSKERAQRLLDNEKELYNLEKQREAYLEAAEAAHLFAVAKGEASGAFDEEKANADYDVIVENTKRKQYDELADEYMSYIDKKNAIDADYEADKAELESAYLKTGDEKYKRSLDERTKAYIQSLNALEGEYNTDDYRLVFGDPSKMTSATIEKALETARKMMARLNKEADPETFKALSEAIDNLEDARDNNPFEGWGTSLMDVIQSLHQIRNLRKDIAKYEAEGNKEAKEGAEAQLEKSKKNLAKALVGTGVATFGDTLSKAAASMREVAEASGDIDLMQQAEALEKAGGFISSVASGAASGGWVGAIIGGATSLMDMLISSITETKVVAAEAKKAFDDYLDELAHKARTINEEDYETIFGVRTLEKVIDASQKARDAYKQYEDFVNDPKPSGHWSDSKGWVDEYDLQSMIVFEGKKQNAKNARASKTLGERFDGLFDENGVLNLEKARLVLQEYSKYSGENWYKALQDATEALEDYEENLKVVDSYLTSLFSNVGSEIADAIMQGNDALEVLEKNAGQIFKSIAKEMIMSVLIGPEFIERYKKMLRDAMATSGAEDDAAVLEGFVDELSSNIEEASEKWEEIKRIAEEKGIDMFGDESESQQTASRKGYETLSEDTGNELVGRATAQYESNLRMEEATRGMKDSIDLMASNYIQIKNIAEESRTLIAHSYLELQQIRDNTGAIIRPIQNLSEKMDKWDSKIMDL